MENYTDTKKKKHLKILENAHRFNEKAENKTVCTL